MATIRPIPLPEFRARVATLYSAAGRAATTRKQLDHALRLAEAAGAATTADLTTETVAALVLARGPGANPNTTRGILLRLRRAVNLAVRGKLLDREDAPDWEAVRPRAVAATRNRPHSEAEVARLLLELDRRRARGNWYAARLHALATLVAYTGLRRNEALHAQVQDLDLGRGFVFVVPRAGNRLKTDASAAPVPLPAEAVRVLRDWAPQCRTWLFPGARSDGPWHGGAPGYRPVDRLRQAGEAAGVARVGFHSLRHSLATHLLLRGVPTWAIQRVLRHTTPITTEHYLHPTDHDVAAIVNGFRYDRTG